MFLWGDVVEISGWINHRWFLTIFETLPLLCWCKSGMLFWIWLSPIWPIANLAQLKHNENNVVCFSSVYLVIKNHIYFFCSILDVFFLISDVKSLKRCKMNQKGWKRLKKSISTSFWMCGAGQDKQLASWLMKTTLRSEYLTIECLFSRQDLQPFMEPSVAIAALAWSCRWTGI